MKSLLITALTFYFNLFPFNSFSQDQFSKIDSFPRPISLLKTNPFPVLSGPILLTSEYRLLYETPITHDQSITAGMSYLNKNLIITIFSPIDSAFNQIWKSLIIRGFRGQLIYKYFLYNSEVPKKKYGPLGVYIGSSLSYSSVKISEEFANRRYNYYMKISYFNINALFGFQYILFRNISIDLFAGLGYKNNIVIENFTNQSQIITNPLNAIPELKHIKATLGFNLGYGF